MADIVHTISNDKIVVVSGYIFIAVFFHHNTSVKFKNICTFDYTAFAVSGKV